jgi:hypothetical protein
MLAQCSLYIRLAIVNCFHETTRYSKTARTSLLLSIAFAASRCGSGLHRSIHELITA